MYPRLFDNIQRYVQSCDICQKTCNIEKGAKAYHVRVPFDFRPMTRLSCDSKHMPVSSKGYKYILFVTCEVSNYTIVIPLFRKNSLSMSEAILNKVVYQFGPPSMIIIDEGRAMSSEVMTYIYEALRIRPIVISPENHGSLRTERYIRTISEMLSKYISQQGQDWHLYLNACCYAHNTFVTPSMGYSPFELEYITMMSRQFNVIKRVVEGKKLQSQQAQLERQERAFSECDEFAVGDLVFLYAPTLSGLQSSFKQERIGPLKVQTVLDQSHFLLADWQGKLLPFFGSVHINQLRHCYINLCKMDGKQVATVHKTNDLIVQWLKLYSDD